MNPDCKIQYRLGHYKLNLKLGDKVIVTRQASNREAGWNTYWICMMSDNIGKELTVTGNITNDCDYGYRLSDGCFYPWFVLKKKVMSFLDI